MQCDSCAFATTTILSHTVSNFDANLCGVRLAVVVLALLLFHCFIKTYQSQAIVQIRRADRNGDGLVSKDEWLRFSQPLAALSDGQFENLLLSFSVVRAIDSLQMPRSNACEFGMVLLTAFVFVSFFLSALRLHSGIH